MGGFQPVLGPGQGSPPCTCAWGCLRSCLVWGKAGNSASTSLEGHFYLNEKKMVPLCSRSQRQGPGLGRAGRPVRSPSGQAPRAVNGLDARAGRPRRDVRAAWACLPLQVLIPQLNASGRGQEEGSASRSGSLMACEECLCGGNRFPFFPFERGSLTLWLFGPTLPGFWCLMLLGVSVATPSPSAPLLNVAHPEG